MKKSKEILVLILAFAMILLSVNFSFAADKLTATTTSNGVTVKWEYELEEDNVVNLVCTNKSEIAGKVEIPSKIDGKTVTTIGNKAFQNCYGMSEVIFPDTLTYIGDYAFENCTGLKSLTLPNKVTSTGVGSFKGDAGLKSVTLSNKLTILNLEMFCGCSGLSTIKIPDNVTTVFGKNNIFTGSKGAFQECTGLKSIVIPETVSTIQNDAFYNVSTDKLTVYGVKGSYAEEWAKEKGYTFDVIENYNPNGTTEKKGPKVTDIYVTTPESGTYKAPQTVKVAVVFDQSIKGTAPTLTIKFGEGTERKVTNGVVTNATTDSERFYFNRNSHSNYVLYSYNIQNDDEGQLQAVSVKGGTITDENGNEAVLSCPATTGNNIVANKTGVTTNNTENQDKTNNTTTTENKTTNKTNTTSNTTNTTKSNTNTTKNITIVSTTNTTSNKSNKTDSTTTTKTTLPKTGKDIAIFGIITLVILLGVVGIAKYYKYKDIK